MKYYVVLRGYKTGIFTTRTECKQNVDGFFWATYKSFTTLQAAEFSWKEKKFWNKWKLDIEYLHKILGKDFQNAICSDAACPSNPGPVEYRTVHIASGKELFFVGPLEWGSVNLAEFLWIVESLIYLTNNDISTTIYSDSKTAISWAQKGIYNTTIKKNIGNKLLFEKLNYATKRLSKNKDWSKKIQLCKRLTKERGQIPADFWRK